MIERHTMRSRQVEPLLDEFRGDVPPQSLMAGYWREVARTKTFVGNLVLICNADAEGWPGIVEVLVDVVVVDHDQRIRIETHEPAMRFSKSIEKRLPGRLLGQFVIVGMCDRRSV